MIKTSDLKFSYGSEQSFSFPDITCDSGAACLILGKSGVGKTTLLHLLGGLIKPDSGSIKVNDRDISKLNDRQMDQFRGKNIGIVFQKPHFISSISIISNLLLVQKLAGRPMDKKEIVDLLDHLGIKQRGNAKPSELSQGELQRASVARAVLNKPAVLLADEPTSALDDVSCEQVMKLLQDTANDLGAALLIVTHDSRLKSIIEHQILLS